MFGICTTIYPVDSVFLGPGHQHFDDFSDKIFILNYVEPNNDLYIWWNNRSNVLK